jgi:hypothetical protein
MTVKEITDAPQLAAGQYIPLTLSLLKDYESVSLTGVERSSILLYDSESEVKGSP